MPKNWKKALMWVSGIALLIFVTLVIHIILVTKPGNGQHANLQLGRIDFPDTLSLVQQKDAMEAIRRIEGMSITKMNPSGTALIYSFPTGKLTCNTVYSKFSAQIDFPSQQYVVSESDIASGCPVMDKSSMAYRFSTFVRNTFH